MRRALGASDPASNPDARMAAKTRPLNVPRFQVLTPAALEAFTKSGPPDGAFVYTTTPEGGEDQLQQWVRDHWEIVGKVYIGDAAKTDDLAVRVSPVPFGYGAGGSGVGAAPRGPNDPSLIEPMGTSPCPPCPPPYVITCAGSLAAVQVASLDDQGFTAVALPITPLEGEPSVVLACMIAACDNIPPDQNMVATGDYTQLSGNVNAPAGHPTTGVMYSDGVIAADVVTASYTPGFDAVHMSSWAGVAVAFRSAALTPRQEASFNFGSGSSPALVTLPGAVLPDSLVIVAVGWRNKFPVEPAAAISDGGGNTELLGSAYAASPPGGSSAGADSAAIYAICGASGDTFGMVGNNDQKFISVSEWVI